MPCPLLYQYHNENHCRATQEKCDCNGVVNHCSNPLAAETYYADKQEEEIGKS